MNSVTVEIKNERQPVTVERRDEHQVVRQISVERSTDEIRQITVETRQAIISISPASSVDLLAIYRSALL